MKHSLVCVSLTLELFFVVCKLNIDNLEGKKFLFLISYFSKETEATLIIVVPHLYSTL